ncbi:hypothetical protein D3C87_1514730 [compost metagenome]
MAARMCGVKTKPSTDARIDRPTKNVVPVPTTRRASSIFRAPTAWPIMIVLAMLMPNTTPSRKNRMILALDVAVSAASPR